MPTPTIYPSLLSCDLARLGEQAQGLIQAGAHGLHVDVMDHHYVPNLTFGPWLCECLRREGLSCPLDVHLMVTPVDPVIQSFIDAGATSISFHPEATLHIDRSLSLIRQGGCEAGLALNPATPFEVLHYVLDKVDFVLVMSVNPGFGGQFFIPAMLDKIQALKRYLQQHKPSVRIAVDGGVNHDLLVPLANAGVDQFIIGSHLFAPPGYVQQLAAFRQRLDTASC